VLSASDWVDGWIARRFDQGSDLGKVLDPVADRILLLVGAIALLVQGSVPIVVGVLVLVREAIISVAVLLLAAAGARRIDVQWAGKAGTFGLMFAFPLIAWGNFGLYLHSAARVIGWLIFVPSIALYYVAAVVYAIDVMKAIRAAPAR
jgi:cardiolipin synthase